MHQVQGSCAKLREETINEIEDKIEIYLQGNKY